MSVNDSPYHRESRLSEASLYLSQPIASLAGDVLRGRCTSFVHEVAHHCDWTTRIGRGRWRMDSATKNEIYAENVQHEWVQRYVIPFLEATYPEEVRALDVWITHHGGISIPLARLAGDPRSGIEGSAIRILFGGIPGAFERLVESVDGGEESVSARVRFARELHYSENYVEALAILERVLAEHPEHEEALTLQADIAVHQEQYERAEMLCQRVIANIEEYPGAWEVLCDVYWWRRDWRNLVKTATRALAFFEPGDYGWSGALLHRARACLELDDPEAFKRDRDLLMNGSDSRRAQADAMALEAVMLLRAGRFEEALQVVVEGAQGHRCPPVELIAARFEAAQKLGRSYEAGELTPSHIERLRYRGYEEWADRLVQEYGP